MKMYSLNINGMVGKEDEIKLFVRDIEPDIFFLQETKTRSTEFKSRLKINGYMEHYCERGEDMKRGGGLGAIWKESINLIPWDLSMGKGNEHLETERQWYILTSKEEKYALLNTYLAFESMENRTWNEKLTTPISSEIQTMVHEGFEIIIAGDLNAKLGKNFPGALANNDRNVDYNGKLILNLMETHRLRVANDMEQEGTLITRRCIDAEGRIWSSTVLDYFITSQRVTVNNFSILKDMPALISSDHYMIGLAVEICTETFKNRVIPRRKLYDPRKLNGPRDAQYGRIAQQNLKRMSLKDFDKLSQKEQIEVIEESLLSAAKIAYPTTKPVKKRKQYISKTLEKLVKKKQILEKKVRLGSATKQEVKDFRKANGILKNTIIKAKHERSKKKAVMLATEDPTRAKFWDIYRTRKDTERGITALKSDEGLVETNPKQMCEVAYKAFQKRLGGSSKQTNLPDEIYDNELFGEEMLKTVAIDELDNAISSFKNGKAGGPHYLRPELLKLLPREARKYILAWVNNVFEMRSMDSSLNDGIVKLIFKRGSKLDPLSYRPITLTCVLGRLIARYLYL